MLGAPVKFNNWVSLRSLTIGTGKVPEEGPPLIFVLFETGKMWAKTVSLRTEKNVKWNRHSLGFAAHFRSRSKQGKCERKRFHLEPKTNFKRNRRTLFPRQRVSDALTSSLHIATKMIPASIRRKKFCTWNASNLREFWSNVKLFVNRYFFSSIAL